jgi:regulator of protease activity HflC (stomatin/prohibitin superfamily)
MNTILLPIAGLLIFFIISAIRILNEYERGVVFRLGRFTSVKGPGLIIIIPFIDKMTKVSLRTVVHDVPPQDVITKDNVSIKVNAVVYFRVLDPQLVIIEVEDYLYATSQLAQTTLRSIMGESELDEILSSREKINEHLQAVLDKQTDAWGVKVSMVEVKHIDLPAEMQKAMARQAQAERDRRARIISADAEFQASGKLAEAAKIISEAPMAMQLRFLQSMQEVTNDKTSMFVLPIPIDLFTPFIKAMEKGEKKA